MLAAITLTVVAPADHVAGPPQGQWTASDYAQLPDDERFELVNGVLLTTPSVTEPYQAANVRFQTFLAIHVDFTGLGRVYGIPFDVELSPTTIVQPDVMVVLNEHADRITPRGIVGAPDLVVEISSPSTATHDRSTKLQAYAAAGVAEYWLADPYARTVEVLVWQAGGYLSLGAFGGAALVPSRVVPQFPVPVWQLLGVQ